MKYEEYVSYDATGLAELVRGGEVESDDLIQAANARIDRVNPLLNAVVDRFDPERGGPAASPGAPFAGVPFLLKNMDGYLAGVPCTSASRSLADWIPQQDSTMVARYKEAGLRIVGKTNCPEFGILGVSEPELYGPARNPWNPHHTPGGSSGGSAAAVAAGIVPMASAGDGGGSIRIPASACGLFGFKPSRGLTPVGPEGNPWLGLVSRHVLTRSVRDSALALDATAGADPGAPFAAPTHPRSFTSRLPRKTRRLRIGVTRASFLGIPLHPDNEAAVSDAVALLESLGHTVVDYDLPLVPDEMAKAYLTIVAAAVAADVRATQAKTGLQPSPDRFESLTWFLSQIGDALSARDLYEAAEYSAHMGRRLGQDFGPTIDVHLSASTAAPPVAIGELALGAPQRFGLAALQHIPVPGAVLRQALERLAAQSLEKTPQTQIFNMTGQPAMSLPLFVNDNNLPIGVQVAGALGADELLLRLAAEVERARPWQDRLPQIG